MSTDPYNILQTIYPTLVQCARYADLIQHRIEAVPDKVDAKNIFAAALSDADLSIQAAVEIALLGNFPEIPFFGEEYKDSRNTKYLSGITFSDRSPYLITLDPIDGTRLYLDGKKLYQIILTVISKEAFEAAIILYPAFGDFVYALKGKGAFHGKLDESVDDAKPWRLNNQASRVYVSSEFASLKEKLLETFDEVYSSSWYSKDTDLHYTSSAIRNQLKGATFSKAQIIDGAALSFVAHEMGYLLEAFDGKGMPRPIDHPDMIFPGLMIAEDQATLEVLRRITKIRAA